MDLNDFKPSIEPEDLKKIFQAIVATVNPSPEIAAAPLVSALITMSISGQMMANELPVPKTTEEAQAIVQAARGNGDLYETMYLIGIGIIQGLRIANQFPAFTEEWLHKLGGQVLERHFKQGEA